MGPIAQQLPADESALMAAGDAEAAATAGGASGRFAPILLYNGDLQEARQLLGAPAWRRKALCLAGGMALACAAVAAVGTAARQPALWNSAGAQATGLAQDGAAGAGGEADAKAASPAAAPPPGCCSWDLTHCGEVKGLCVGGVKECEQCKGQWISNKNSTCDVGHSLENPLPTIWGYTGANAKKATQVKVLSYNLFWWHLFDKMKGGGGSAGHLIRDTAADQPYDFMGFQECNQVYQVLWDAGLDGKYGALHTWSNMCIAYRKDTWEHLADGQRIVAQDASWGGPGQNYGQRMAMWVHVRNKETNETVFFMNHHGPLPLSSGGDWGGPTTARKLLETIQMNATKDEAVIFVGDFNAHLWSMTVKQLECRLQRVVSGTAPEPGLDHIFTNLDSSRVVKKDVLGTGGSDHHAISAVFSLGPQSGQEPKDVQASV